MCATQVKQLFYLSVQTAIDEDSTETTELKKTKKKSIIESLIEPEKVITDSFITEDTDGRKVNVTRKISTRKVKRIIYSDQVIFVDA